MDTITQKQKDIPEMNLNEVKEVKNLKEGDFYLRRVFGQEVKMLIT